MPTNNRYHSAKGKSGAFLRVAAIKVLLKLQREQVDPMIVMLLETVVRMSEILYSQDSRRNLKMILRLYNCSWLHHELCCHFLSTPKLQTRSHLFGAYLHALVVHAPPQYQIVCLRAESQERLFSKAKHISLKATNCKPDNVLPTILISIQAQQKMGDCQQSIKKQDSIVSSVSSKMPKYQGTFFTISFLRNRLPSWQAHLQRISTYLEHGEGVWWKQKEEGYKFLDSDSDHAFHTAGPSLMHFRDTILPTVYNQSARVWNAIVSSNTTLPTPSISLYDDDGNYVGTRVCRENPMVPHQQPGTPIVPHQQPSTPIVPHQQPGTPVVPHQQPTTPILSHQPTVLHQQPTIEPTIPVVSNSLGSPPNQ